MKRIYLSNFGKRLNCVLKSNISHKKYQILIVLWLFEWQIVLIRAQSNCLPWTTCVFLKAFWMVKHVTFRDFSAILVFENFLKGPIQYSLIQRQQWKHQDNVPNMFKVDNKETRMTLMTSFWCLYCWCFYCYSTHCSVWLELKVKWLSCGKYISKIKISWTSNAFRFQTFAFFDIIAFEVTHLCPQKMTSK